MDGGVVTGTELPVEPSVVMPSTLIELPVVVIGGEAAWPVSAEATPAPRAMRPPVNSAVCRARFTHRFMSAIPSSANGLDHVQVPDRGRQRSGQSGEKDGSVASPWTAARVAAEMVAFSPPAWVGASVWRSAGV